MKRLFIFIFLIAATASSFGQQPDTTRALTKTDYLQKSKGQKTAAWVLLGVGVACFAIAAPGDVSFDAAGALAVVGTLAIVGSIPLFISAAKNKKRAKAASAAFKMETSPVIRHSNIASKTYPALSIKINL